VNRRSAYLQHAPHTHGQSSGCVRLPYWAVAHPFRGPRNHFLSRRNRPEIKLIYQMVIKQRGSIMLSEKFILILEAILKSNNRSFPDGAPRVVSTSPHVPVKLPARN
jgi:hypothetical protein